MRSGHPALKASTFAIVAEPDAEWLTLSGTINRFAILLGLTLLLATFSSSAAAAGGGRVHNLQKAIDKIMELLTPDSEQVRISVQTVAREIRHTCTNDRTDHHFLGLQLHCDQQDLPDARLLFVPDYNTFPQSPSLAHHPASSTVPLLTLLSETR